MAAKSPRATLVCISKDDEVPGLNLADHVSALLCSWQPDDAQTYDQAVARPPKTGDYYDAACDQVHGVQTLKDPHDTTTILEDKVRQLKIEVHHLETIKQRPRPLATKDKNILSS